MLVYLCSGLSPNINWTLELAGTLFFCAHITLTQSFYVHKFGDLFIDKITQESCVFPYTPNLNLNKRSLFQPRTCTKIVIELINILSFLTFYYNDW